jgi:hypothetical protein
MEKRICWLIIAVVVAGIIAVVWFKYLRADDLPTMGSNASVFVQTKQEDARQMETPVAIRL